MSSPSTTSIWAQRNRNRLAEPPPSSFRFRSTPNGRRTRPKLPPTATGAGRAQAFDTDHSPSMTAGVFCKLNELTNGRTTQRKKLVSCGAQPRTDVKRNCQGDVRPFVSFGLISSCVTCAVREPPKASSFSGARVYCGY